MIGLGRAYSVTFANVSIAAQQDLFYVKPAADKICFIEAFYLSNVGIAADAGDAQEELWDIELVRLASTVTAGTSGTTPTPVALAVNDTAAGFATAVNQTVKATSNGSTAILHADGINVRIPYVYMPPPEHRPVVANAQAVALRLNSTPTDAVLFNGTLIVREIP